MRYLLILFALFVNVIYAETCPATYNNLPFNNVGLFPNLQEVDCNYYDHLHDKGATKKISGNFAPESGPWQFGLFPNPSAYTCDVDSGGSAQTCVFNILKQKTK